jgi:putative SOS response-associated peptidase YedK
MCYQVSSHQKKEAIYKALPELTERPLNFDFDLCYITSGFTLPPLPVVLEDKDACKLKLQVFEWGMMTTYMKGDMTGPDKKLLDKQRFKLLNARAERILGDTSSVWYPKRHNRLLLPVNGFFEYRAVPGFKNKIPYYIHLKDRPLFFLPGLYSYAHIPTADGELTGTFTLVIRAANSVMRSIHNSGDHPYRMPLMLPQELERKWLDPKLTDQELQSILNYELPSAALEYYPVKSLYRASPLDPTLIEQAAYPGLAPVTTE